MGPTSCGDVPLLRSPQRHHSRGCWDTTKLHGGRDAIYGSPSSLSSLLCKLQQPLLPHLLGHTYM
jgi:hypothetical protein